MRNGLTGSTIVDFLIWMVFLGLGIFAVIMLIRHLTS